MSVKGPRRCNRFANLLGRTVMAVSGWRIVGEVPDADSIVVIAAPHTSNWDFIYLMAAAYSFGISINYLAKDSLFKIPVLGTVLKFMGGVAVNRSKATNMVQSLADEINNGAGINLIVPPSGTRSKTDHWKSGFYRIAETANVPIVCGFLDYPRKVAGLGPSFLPTDLKSDMDRIRRFYEPIAGKYPENKSDIRLREEED